MTYLIFTALLIYLVYGFFNKFQVGDILERITDETWEARYIKIMEISAGVYKYRYCTRAGKADGPDKTGTFNWIDEDYKIYGQEVNA